VENFKVICISFDDRIGYAVNKMIKIFDYVEFSPQIEHASPLKQRLKKVVRMLREFDFISMRKCRHLMSKIEDFYFREEISNFLKSVD
jgi:hypothetical protein